MNDALITCPSCGYQFEAGEAFRNEVEKELRNKMIDWQKLKEKQFAEDKNKFQQQLEETLRKNIALDFETKFLLLEQNNKDNEERLKVARQKELDFLQKEQLIKNREEELDITVQKMLHGEREKLSEDIRKLEQQKSAAHENELHLKLKELEKQLGEQKELAEEMKRKVEQGSIQLQGEVQELALEEMLRTTFPFDIISEVPKGVRGADCIQTVRNNFGQECGKIIYESKRTKNFDKGWVEKLKTDMRATSSDSAVLVTQAIPEELGKFGEINGVWICSFTEVKPVVHMLRNGIIKVSAALRSQENKGDKMHLLYSYLTSNEFAEQWKAIREGFMSMKLSIQKERDAMEKLWKAREKQLEKILLNAAHVKGSIEGIAGMDAVDLNLLENSSDINEEGT